MATTTTSLETTALAAGDGRGAPPPKSYWAESWERLRGNRVGMTAGAVILAFGLIGLLAPLVSTFVTRYDPNRQVLLDQFASISTRHPLGTDELGRDTLTRLIYGARVSYLIGFLTVSLSLTIGSTIGIVAGF